MKEIKLAKLIYNSEPLNKYTNTSSIKEQIAVLSNEQKLNLLTFSFQNYDKNYNIGLCLNFTILWSTFEVIDWKQLIITMFPRKAKYEMGNFKELFTGSYCDIFLLNGIIGVSPFEFIFQTLEIDKVEKKHFLTYFEHYGEVNFYYNEREMIEDIVTFYELNTFVEIVKMKKYLIATYSFKPSLSYADMLIKLNEIAQSKLFFA